VEECVDQNWCDSANCGENSDCTDLVAPEVGFVCTCIKGYELADPTDPNSDCQKVDPCGSFPCDGADGCGELTMLEKVCVMCTNLGAWPNFAEGENGRTCWCPSGYTLGEEGKCEDFNACTASPCDPNAACADKPPPTIDTVYKPAKAWFPPTGHPTMRTCVCLPGFRGDGELCVEDASSAGGLGGGIDEEGNAIVEPNDDGNAAASASDTKSSTGTIKAVVGLMGLIVVVGIIAVIAMRLQERRQSADLLRPYEQYATGGGGGGGGGMMMQPQGGMTSFVNPAFQ